jgi:flagellar protein FliS
LANGRIAHEYRKNAVNGASPLQLVIMLYDGALRFMEAGRHAMAHGDLPRQNDQLQRAQKIVMELMACVDLEKGGEIAKNLLSLYTYVLDELVKANVEDNAERIERGMRVMRDLRESWAEIAQRERPLAA